MLIFDQLKKNDPRLRFVAVGVLAGLLTLVAGLWYHQVMSARHYAETLKSQSFRTIRVPAIRGKILDCNGTPLAENRPDYRVNLFLDLLRPMFTNEFARQKTAVLAVYDVGDLEAIKKYNSITLDAEGRITFFEEKPKNPTSTLTGIALYYFPAEVVAMIQTYIDEGNNHDQPGRFIQWLYPRVPVHTWRVPGRWFDIGSKETLEEADRIFGQ